MNNLPQSDDAPCFVTECWLRERFGLGHGTEIHLPHGCKLTPSAKQLLDERQIRVKQVDAQGRMFVEGDGEDEQLNQVHPLKTNNIRPENACTLCGQQMQKKPEVLTHLDDKQLVLKNHPRIKLRGKLDSLICYCVVVQTEFDQQREFPRLHTLLVDLRSFMGSILRSEVTGETLALIHMGPLDDEAIHAISHQPLKFLGHDHILPEIDHGPDIAKLNYLRALVRECELIATDIYLDNTFEMTRNDLIQGFNRLSSAIYVLMLLTLVCRQGNLDILEKVVAHEAS